MTDEVKIEMPTNVNGVSKLERNPRDLDVNGIPKIVLQPKAAKPVSESGTYTATTLYDSVNAIKDLIMKPGELFIMNEKTNGGSILNGFNNGIAFVAVIGSILAVTAIALGVPDAHLQFRPSLIFGFA